MMAGLNMSDPASVAAFLGNNPALRKGIEAGIAKNKVKQERDAGLSALSQQLGGQASQYGFSWKGNKSADVHQRKVAELLYDKGVRNLSDVGYSKDGKNLINKNTGQIVPFYKNRAMGKDGKGQIGWNAAGKGRTNYYVQADAQGNPVFTPQWKSNAPGGVGGFLIKAAPTVAGMIGGPGAAALTQGAIGLASGQKFGEALKGAAITGGTSYLGGKFSNFANANLPMIGNAGITNAIADSIGAAGAGGLRGLATGQNPLKAAALGAAYSGVGSGIGELLGQMPSTGNNTLDKWLRSGISSGLKGVVNPQIAGLFGGSGGANTGRGGTNQNQNQGGVNGMQGGNANTNALLAGMMLGGINQPQPGQQQVRYQMGDSPKLSFV